MKRFASIADLTDPRALETLTGPVSSIHKTLLSGVGYSGSVLYRMEVHLLSGEIRSFILKHTVIRTDWLSQRTHDTVGREAAILDDPYFSRIWESIQCPFVAFALDEGEIAVLMKDVTLYLFPDVREPIELRKENDILNTLASLHASYWASSEIKTVSWLIKTHQYLEMLGPGAHPTDAIAPPPDKVRESMQQGWEMALRLLPVKLRSFITRRALEMAEPWKDLPITLLHGDAKIANMAILPERKVVMFDWTHCGWGPCGIELGWYLAVNSTRLAGSKEEIMAQYRTYLESHLQFRLQDKTWLRMAEVAIITGAMMMLWSKALGYQAGTERGMAEWKWWVERLGKIVNEL